MSIGSELLIVEGTERDRAGLRKLFDGRGLVSTAVGTGEEARDLLGRKVFAVALIDLDVDGDGSGIDLIRYARRASPQTALVLLTGREAFSEVVEAVRAGVVDVCLKTPEQLGHLTELVQRAIERHRELQGEGAVLEEVRGVLDESFKVMLGLSRKVYAHLSLANAPLRPSILVVDGDPDFLRQLSEQIQDKDWIITGEMNGGAALDRGTTGVVHIVASRDELMDLRGSMVIRSIQAQRADVIGLLYSSEGEGKVELIDQGQAQNTERPFRGAKHLVERIDALVETLGTRAEERRFIQAFSADHRPFLRRYAELKLKIDRLLSS